MSPRFPATIALMALTCGVWMTAYSLTHQVHGAPVRLPRSHEETADRMFPDGKTHDFGKVPHGTQAKCAFRIVNTSDAPIRVGEVRASSSCLSAAYSTKSEIQPNEQAEIEIVVDTRRFVGPRTQSLYVTMEIGKRLTTARFWVTAFSQDDSRP